VFRLETRNPKRETAPAQWHYLRFLPGFPESLDFSCVIGFNLLAARETIPDPLPSN
jgi:hypothetical protein